MQRASMVWSARSITIWWRALAPAELAQGSKQAHRPGRSTRVLSGRGPATNVCRDWRANSFELRLAVLAATGGLAAALAAKAATQTVVIFTGADDTIGARLVASFNRLGGNITGVTAYPSVLRGKRMEFLIGLVPSTRY